MASGLNDLGSDDFLDQGDSSPDIFKTFAEANQQVNTRASELRLGRPVADKPPEQFAMNDAKPFTYTPLFNDLAPTKEAQTKAPVSDGGFAYTPLFSDLEPKKAESNPFMHGLKSGGIDSAKESAVGGAALIAHTVGAKDTADKLFTNLQGMQKESEANSKEYESFSNVTSGKASFGDFFGHWAGYAVGQAAQTVAVAAAGAAVGSVIPGAGTAAGAIGGVFERGVAQEGIKKLVASKMEGMVAKNIAENTAKGMALAEAETLAYQQSAKTVFREIGVAAAVTGQNVMMEGSSIYSDARGDAEKRGEEVNLGRVWTGTILAAATESAMDFVGLKGIQKAAGGGNVFKNIAVESFKGGLREGSTEAVQTGFERFGAGRDLASSEAIHDYIDSAAAGAVGGVMFGSAKGTMKSMRGEQDTNEKMTVEQARATVVQQLDSDEGRRTLYDSMMEDPRVAAALKLSGIESHEDPRFDKVVMRSIKTSQALEGLDVPTAEEISQKTKDRKADSQAAFGDTASTATGVGTGANEPVIRRDSVTPNLETKTLDGEAKPATLTTDGSAIAMSGEDMVSRQGGWEPVPLQAEGKAINNSFVSPQLAETFMYGTKDPATGKRSGGYAESATDTEFQIRKAKRSKEAGGGNFYFVEGRAKSSASTTDLKNTNTAGFTPESSTQVQAQVDAVKDGRKVAAITGEQESKSVNSDGLTTAIVKDPETGLSSAVYSKDKGVGKKVQKRIGEVGLKQSMGEVLGYVEPGATTNPDVSSVVVRQTDNTSGEVIQEQVVTPANVSKIPAIKGTKNEVVTVAKAQADRKQKSEQVTEQVKQTKPVKQTVEQNLKDKETERKKAKAEKEVSDAKSVQADPTPTKDEVAKSTPPEKPAAKADKAVEPTKQAAPVKDAKVVEKKEAAPKVSKSAVREGAIESWEDNDDGKAAHTPFEKLSKENQDAWLAAYSPDDGEASYSTALYHDELVQRDLRAARVERSNKRVADARASDEDLNATFRVKTVGDTGMSKASVEKITSLVTAKWENLPPIVVVATEDDLPIKALSQIKKKDSSGLVPGMYYNGKVYLIAGNIHDANDAVITIAHEVTGHFGLRSIFGEGHAEKMLELYKGNKAIRTAADAMMVKEGLSKVIAIEEALADMAERDPSTLKADEKTALTKLYEAIRKWLLDTLNISNVSDQEIEQIVANARAYVIEGKGTEGKGGVAGAAQSVKNEATLRTNGTPTFYSALERSTRMAKQESAPAKDWIAIISKLPGVKSEEVEWTGVNEWLSEQTGKVTKTQVLDYIGNNKMRLYDHILIDMSSTPTHEDMRAKLFELIDLGDLDESSDPTYLSNDELQDAIATSLGLGNFVRQFKADQRKLKARHGDLGHNLVLPNGRGYVELTVSDPGAIEYKKKDEVHFGDVTHGKTIGWLRMNIRDDVNGNPVLFLEEIQSQRANDGRKGGFGADGAVPDGPFIKSTDAWTSLLLKRAIAYAQENGIDRISWTNGEQQSERYAQDPDEKGLAYYYDTKLPSVAKELLRKLGSGGSIEQMKFKGMVRGQEYGLPSDSEFQANKKSGETVVSYVARKNEEAPSKETTHSGFVITEKLQQLVSEDGMPTFRLRDYEEQFADLPANVRAMAVTKGHRSPPKIMDRLKALQPNLARRIVQGTFDKFHAIKDIGDKFYIMARMSNGPQEGGLSVLVHHGQVFNDGGALNIKKGTKGLVDVLKEVGPEVDRYLMWVAANRAGELKKDERENFFTQEEIDTLKKLNLGTMKDGKSRVATYIKTLQGMNELNKSVLDVAKGAGLIDDAAYKKFSNDVWYVPFYRQMEDDKSLSGAQTSSGHVNQYLSKKLKGSSRGVNDLMENVLNNWSHILSASMKNNSAVETLGAAEKMGGIVSRLTKIDDKFGRDTAGNVIPLKYTVKVMEAGKPIHYEVHDEFLLTSLDSIASMGSSNWALDIAGQFKTTLTRFVSLSPTFKINNLIRDSVQSLALSDNGNSPWANAKGGYDAYHKDKGSALAGGGLTVMGNAFDGDQASNIKRILKSGVKSSNVLDTTSKAKEWFGKFQDKYDDISDGMENANRISLYNRIIAKGGSHLEASFQARDLQDFSLQGSWDAIRYASKVLPYFNARMQGLYKIGRDGLSPVQSVLFGKATDGERKKATKFAVVLGAITMVELALYLAQMDDEDWKKREEWDKDSFYWFKLPGTENAVRIPKPFELGAIGTAIGRVTEQIIDPEVEGKLFRQRMTALLHDNFAINPIPQIIRPVWDLAANKDGFTGRDIESMGMEHMSKTNRVNPGTSAMSVGLNKINDFFAQGVSAVTGVDANNLQLSPIQIDYAVRGYLGWVGSVMQSTSTLAVSPLKAGESADMKIDDYPIIGTYLKSLPPSQSKYITAFYDHSKEVTTAVADYKMLSDAHRADEAFKFAEENGDKLQLAKIYSSTTAALSKVSGRIKMVQAAEDWTGAEKRTEIDRLNAMRTSLAKRAEDMRMARAHRSD